MSTRSFTLVLPASFPATSTVSVSSVFAPPTPQPGPVPLPLAQVKDMDCVVSLKPLVFDMTGRFVVGAPAIVRRVLYQWYRAGYLDVEGSTPDTSSLASQERTMERIAEECHYVQSCRAKIDQASTGDITIAGDLVLDDGRKYPFEVVASAAKAAVLGGT